MRPALVLAVVASVGCPADDGEGPRIYAPTESLAFDCQAGPGAAVDPARPRELVGEELVSVDGGATWRRLVDEAGQPIRPAAGAIGGPYALGDGRWFVVRSGDGVMIDTATAAVRVVALAPMVGPDLQFRAADLGDGTWVGVGGRGRVYTSRDGAAWTGRDGEFAGLGLALGCTLWARGDRAWQVCPSAGQATEVSADGGRTFTRFTPPAPFTHLIHLAIGADGTLAAIFGDASGQQPWISVSEDAGATWRYGGGEPDWIFRQTTVRVYVLADGTILANGDLNIDAAAPNPPGRYWLVSRDRAVTWSIVRATSGGEVVTAFPPAAPGVGGTFLFPIRDGHCAGPVAGAGRYGHSFTVL